MIPSRSKQFASQLPWKWILLALLVIFPFAAQKMRAAGLSGLTGEFSNIMVFCILALALNVVVGYTGLLHLGIAGFFAIGSFTTGILCVPSYPFQTGFVLAAIGSMAAASILGLVLAAPTLRLRGDYLAIVTLGFGEVVKITLRNLEEITNGTRTIYGWAPLAAPQWLSDLAAKVHINLADNIYFYYVALFILLLVILALRNLERSSLGRAWVAIREDELAAASMGINIARVKMLAFVISSALAGLAGCLYATRLTNTSDPNIGSFNKSVFVLCYLIVGGLGSTRGALLGVFLLVGYENIAAPFINGVLEQQGWKGSLGGLVDLSRWNLMVFGLALILMMRFRPEGLLPSSRIQQELHETDPDSVLN
ncbi:MAG: branched-chain amino acid ABC transporter permease [Planctomycetota bacterium]|nr:branched-chain amino acid ABC transporter permease [Planctomycetota bacterium]